MRNNQPVTGVEHSMREDQSLVSRTDTSGNITYVNQSFIEMSGFGEEDLLGAPHIIVRHPDMPVEAFEDLWATLRSGHSWAGMVKNRRSGIEQVGQATARMDTATQQNWTLVEEGATAAVALQLQGSILVKSMGVFRLN